MTHGNAKILGCISRKRSGALFMGSQEQIFPAREGRQHRAERGEEKRGEEPAGWTPSHTHAEGLDRGRREKQEEI